MGRDSRVAVLLLAVALLSVGCRARPEPEAGIDRREQALEAQRENEKLIEAAAATLGMPLYPNAIPSTTRTAYQHRENVDGMRYWLLLSTKDSIETVAAFYKEKMGLFERRAGNSVQLEGTTNTGSSITISFGKIGTGETEFMIMGTVKAAGSPGPVAVANTPGTPVPPVGETPVQQPPTTAQTTPPNDPATVEPTPKQPEPTEPPPATGFGGGGGEPANQMPPPPPGEGSP